MTTPAWFLLFAALSSALPQGPGEEAEERETARRTALIVGVDRYAPGTPASFPSLEGCRNDALHVRSLLIERFGFAPEEILVLVDEEATHQRVVQAFHERLILRSGPETEALFWYSGHGSRVPDASGREGAELDDLDSSLILYDSRSGGEDGAYDFTDDELHSLVSALARRTGRITVVTDSCHSGAVVRGSGDGVRAAPPGTEALDRERLEPFWPSGVPFLDDDARTEGAEPAYVHVAACGPRQVAREIPLVDESGEAQVHGALTFFLTQALERSQPGTSYRRVADDAAVRLSTRFPAQTVWVEGAADRALFSGRFAERPDGYLARSLAGAEIAIEAGSVHGLRAGSVCAVYDAAQTERLGTATVQRVTSLAARARWDQDEPPEIDGALRLIEVRRAQGQDPLALHAPDPPGFLEESAWVALVEPHLAEYHLVPTDEGDVLYAPGDLKLWVGQLDEEAAEELDEVFRKELRHRGLLAFATQPGSLRLEAGFVAPDEDELERFGIPDARVTASSEGSGRASGREYRAGATPDAAMSLAILRVANPHSEALHVTVLSVAEDRSCNVIWPVRGGRDNVLEPEAERRIPVGVLLQPNWSAGRPMRDRYLVVGTKTWADFSIFESQARMRSAGPRTDGVPAVLLQALDGPLTRGARRVQRQADWGVLCVDLLVEAKSPTPR